MSQARAEAAEVRKEFDQMARDNTELTAHASEARHHLERLKVTAPANFPAPVTRGGATALVTSAGQDRSSTRVRFDTRSDWETHSRFRDSRTSEP